MYPDIDDTYTTRTYYGERLTGIRTTPVTFGYKRWANLTSGFQGMAIWRNYLVRMHAVSASTSHSIYRISESGTLTEIATFTCSTSGHSNAAQFAPTIEGNNAFPYLYVSDTSGYCVVLNIAADYTATQVQKIIVPVGWQVLIGDDGYIWALANPNQHIRIIKYRKVSVSEGAEVTLTNDDILEDFTGDETFNSEEYTFQGMSVKFGKVWIPIGNDGAGNRRALVVYDCLKQKAAANIDLTELNVEFEDCDFWDDALIVSCYEPNTYILRF